MLIKSRKIFYTLLFIVFAFQIAFIGTVAYYFVTHRVVFQEINHGDIREKYQEIRDKRPEIHSKYRECIQPLNERNRELRIKFLRELVKAEPDYDSLSKLQSEIQEVTQEISRNFYNEMLETRKSLTPDEAKIFYGNHLRMMQRRFNLPRDESQMRHHPSQNEMGPPPEMERRRQNRPNM